MLGMGGAVSRPLGELGSRPAMSLPKSSLLPLRRWSLSEASCKTQREQGIGEITISRFPQNWRALFRGGDTNPPLWLVGSFKFIYLKIPITTPANINNYVLSVSQSFPCVHSLYIPRSQRVIGRHVRKIHKYFRFCNGAG